MATNIYFIRHGEVDNKSNIYYGRLPRMKLSEKGRQQIRQSAEYLKDKAIANIFSSNLMRAKQSAEIIRSVLNSQQVSKSNLITEVNSYMEGKPFIFGKSSRFDHYFSPLRKPENETMEEIRDRMINFIYNVDKRYKGKNLAVVSHGDPLMILKASINGLPMELTSIRSGDGQFIKHGEIYLVQVSESNLTVKRVFVPHL